MRTSIQLNTMATTKLEELLHDVVVLHKDHPSIERVLLIDEGIIKSIVAAEDKHIGLDILLVLPWINESTDHFTHTQYTAIEDVGGDDVEVILRGDNLGNKTVISIETSSEDDDYDNAIVNIHYEGSESRYLEELETLGISDEDIDNVVGDLVVAPRALEEQQDGVASLEDRREALFDLPEEGYLKRLVEEVQPTYNSVFSELTTGNYYRTFSSETLGELSTTVFDGELLTVSHQYINEYDEKAVGSIVVETEQVKLYNAIMPIYVIGLGAIRSLSLMQHIVEVDLESGNNPVYPLANNLDESDIKALGEHMRAVVNSKKRGRYTNDGTISAVTIDLDREIFVVRINWMVNTVSIEYRSFTVARMFAGEPTLANCLEFASSMRGVLYRIIKANTGQSLPASTKATLVNTLNSYIKASKKLLNK